MNTDGIIGLDDLLASALSVPDTDALVAVVKQLAQIEPYLAGYLDNEMTLFAGKMALAGATPMIVRDLSHRMMATILTVFQAQRLASARLWRDGFANTPLAALIGLNIEDPQPPENPLES